MTDPSPAAPVPLDAATVADELAATVWDAATSFRDMDPATAAARPAPGKWSPKEIVGHLVDSAANNHQRFVRAQEAPDQHFPGYAQDHWVAAQDYQSRDWEPLIDLWQAYNLHLAHVIRAVPAEKLETRLRVGDGEPVTLGWLIGDYLRHLRHHVEQILPESGS
jgi:hypothetical protein